MKSRDLILTTEIRNQEARLQNSTFGTSFLSFCSIYSENQMKNYYL